MPADLGPTAGPTAGPTLTFVNGTTTIGGVQALLRSGSSAVLFDFGTAPDPVGSLFSRYSPPPAHGALAAHLRAGMAPLVEGLYDTRQLAAGGGASVAAACEPVRGAGRLLEHLPLVTDLEQVGVFVSHLHQDHCSLLPFLAPEVPLVTSAAGAALHAGLVEAGALAPSGAPVRGVADGDSWRVGEIDLELVAVDHDIPGATGFVAHAGGLRVAWTGDWRAHGHAPEVMLEFARRAAGVDLLVTEGTTLAPDAAPFRALPESELAERVDALLARTEGLVLVTAYPRNLERLAALADVAAANGRTLVLRRQTLAGWQAAARHGLTGPDLAGRAVAVLDVEDPEEPFLAGVAGARAVTVEDLRRDRGAFLVELQVAERWVALAAGAGPGDLLVHCNGEPLGPWAREWASLTGWVRALGLEMVWLDSGGHATRDDLAWLVEAVQPAAVAAVHSAHPQLFPRTSVPLVLPQRGRPFAVASPAPHALSASGARGADPSRGLACASS